MYAPRSFIRLLGKIQTRPYFYILNSTAAVSRYMILANLTKNIIWLDILLPNRILIFFLYRLTKIYRSIVGSMLAYNHVHIICQLTRQNLASSPDN